MSPLLEYVENTLLIAALTFTIGAGMIRVSWIFRFRGVRERSRAEGRAGAGAGRSLANVVRPRARPSTRRNFFFAAQFAVFHLGAAAVFAAAFLISCAPAWLDPKGVVIGFRILFGLAFAAALVRFVRRLRIAPLRAVSAPDDYAAIILMMADFILAIPAVANHPERDEGPMIAFFILTAVILIYAPFSKISHSLSYPFSRFFLGRTLGRRGVLPSWGK